jgi:glutamate-5-semialdehyde dehydrogenase
VSIDSIARDVTRRARDASERLAELPSDQKDSALCLAADRLEASSAEIRDANGRDLDAGRAEGIPAPMLDRLELTEARIASMAQGLRDIAALRRSGACAFRSG